MQSSLEASQRSQIIQINWDRSEVSAGKTGFHAVTFICLRKIIEFLASDLFVRQHEGDAVRHKDLRKRLPSGRGQGIPLFVLHFR